MKDERSIRVREAAPVQSIATEIDGESVSVRAVREDHARVDSRKVDELKKLQDRLADIKKRHKEELTQVAEKVKALETELTEMARERGEDSIRGVDFILEFTPSVSRVIDPKKFLHFMKENGTVDLFFDYVSVPVGKATKDMGEKVLLDKGVLTIDSVPLANKKISQRLVD